MAARRRRRRRKRDDLAALIPIGIVAYFLIAPDYGPVVYGLLAASVVLFWVAFAMPTLCGYDLGYRGCIHQHGALKRDAMFAAVRMRNPGQLVRVKWQDGPVPKGRTVGAASGPPPSAADRKNARKGTYDMIMLTVATIGSVAGVLALFISK